MTDPCTGCGLTGRCPAHPAHGRLQVRDTAAEFRELYGDQAEEFAVTLSPWGEPLPEHDWRLMVEYGPHPDGDRRNGRVTFHNGADAAHVAAYLAREHIELRAPEVAATRVPSDCCDGTGYADYAAVRCPNPKCPVPETQWRAEAITLDDNLADAQKRGLDPAGEWYPLGSAERRQADNG